MTRDDIDLAIVWAIIIGLVAVIACTGIVFDYLHWGTGE